MSGECSGTMVVFTSGIVDARVLSSFVGWVGYSCLTLVGVGSSTLLGPEGSAAAGLGGVLACEGGGRVWVGVVGLLVALLSLLSLSGGGGGWWGCCLRSA